MKESHRKCPVLLDFFDLDSQIFQTAVAVYFVRYILECIVERGTEKKNRYNPALGYSRGRF